MIKTVIKILILLLVTLVLSTSALIFLPIDRKGWWYRLLAFWWSEFIFWIFNIKIHVKGIEDINLEKPHVFVSNHASMFDIPAVVVALQGKVNIVFKKELARVPIWGWALKYGPFIMIDRSNAVNAIKSIERAARSISNGHSVILFPEGTRTTDGKLQVFKRGAFSLAIKAGVPIVPIVINGTFKIMPKGSLNIKPADIFIIVNKPIDTQNLNGKEDELKLMNIVHKVIENDYINQ